MASTTCEVKLRRGEPVEKGLRRLKKLLDREGILKDMRGRKCFEKPGDKRRKKQARARSRALRDSRMSSGNSNNSSSNSSYSSYNEN
ncbi:MAG: 30S ribosomal protein S21 [Pontiellaceae bacterium]|jgi:small subunit ribosomal protein S21|nr:30S ribosomal protein S21 [Pontiellaceae bacterium]